MAKAIPSVQPQGEVAKPQISIWNFAVGAIALAFIVYVTAKGELGTWIQLLFYTPPAQQPANVANAQPSQSNVPGNGLQIPGFNIPGVGSTGGVIGPGGPALPGGEWGVPGGGPNTPGGPGGLKFPIPPGFGM